MTDITKVNKSASLEDGWIHIDFMDNIFVPNKSIDPAVVAKYPTKLKKEAHLMVSRPLEWIEGLVKAGFERVIFHIEAKDDTNECIDYIKQKNLDVGIALNFDTKIEKLVNFKDKIDVILVMSIVPGFQGQPFIPRSLDKITQLKSLGWSVKIAVDGAVKDTNVKKLIEAGADRLVIGSYLLKGDIDANLETIWEQIQG